ncbi:MAG TPA: hypothetical protein VM012_13150 [Flavitalea sp.]|nr:hypothetical protein [Flavitalea sp.]
MKGKANDTKAAYEQQAYCNSKIPTAFHRMMQPGKKEAEIQNHSEKSNDDMITKVIARPNPFFTSVTLEVSCTQSRHTIVRMMDNAGKIVKLFSWYMVKGSNVTTITEMGSMNIGGYIIDILDSEGNTLFNTALTKA